jgi:ferredoxin
MTNRDESAALHIDWTKCDGRGLCTELLSGRLVRDPWGYPLAAGPDAGRNPGDKSNVPIGADDLEAAEDAVVLCPRLALTLLHRSGRRSGPR